MSADFDSGGRSRVITPLTLAKKAARIADNMKGENVLLLDLRKLTIITDFFVICDSRSIIGVKSIAEEILGRLKEDGVSPNHIEGLAEGNWVLIDYGDAIVHIFHEQVREFYDLESLWGDAPRPSFRPSRRKAVSRGKAGK